MMEPIISREDDDDDYRSLLRKATLDVRNNRNHDHNSKLSISSLFKNSHIIHIFDGHPPIIMNNVCSTASLGRNFTVEQFAHIANHCRNCTKKDSSGVCMLAVNFKFFECS